MRYVVGLSMLVCAGVFVGWCAQGHEGRDVRVKQATLALQKGRPDLALRLINPVLAAEPNDLGARMLVIRARVKMSQFRYALSHANQLVMLHPDRIDLRRGRIDVLMAVLEAQLSISTASDEVMALGAFEALLATATSDVDVVSDVLDAHELKMMRIRLVSLQVRDLTRTLSLRPDDSCEQDDTLRWQLQDFQSKLESELKQMVVDHPRQFEAWRMYIELLVSRNDVVSLGQVADTLSHETILPPAIATELVKRLVFVDATTHELETRLALGQRLLAAVHPRDRTDARWVRTQATLGIVSGQAEESLAILDRLPRHQRYQTAVLLIRARALSDLGRFAEVVGILQPLALQRPHRTDIQTLLGFAYTALDQLDDAERAFRVALTLIPDGAASLEGLATVLVRQGKFDEAGGIVRQLAARHPDRLNIISMQIQIAKANHREDEVRSLLVRLAQRQSQPDATLMMLIDGYDFLKEYAQVELYAQALLERDASSIVARLGMAKSYLFRAEYMQALHWLESLHAEMPNRAEISILMGRIHIARNRYELAADTLEPVVATQPANIEASMLLAQSLARMHRDGESRAILTALLRRRPGHAPAQFMLWQLDNITVDDGAHRHKSPMASITPVALDAPSTLVIARDMMVKGDLGSAKVYALSAVEKEPQHVESRLVLADIFMQLGQINSAKQQLHALAMSHPRLLAPYHAMYNLFMRSHQLEDGLRMAAALRDVNRTLAIYLQGLLQLTLGRDQSALVSFEQALALAIQSEDRVAIPIAGKLVNLYRSQGDAGQVAQIYSRMFDVQTLATEARLHAIDQDDMTILDAQFVSRLDKAAESVPADRKDLIAELMTRFDQAHQGKRVLTLLEKWIADSPQDLHLYRAKAQLLSAMGRTVQALAAWEDALAIDQGNLQTWRLLIDFHRRELNFPAAEQAIRRMGKLDKHAAVEAMLLLAALYQQTGLSVRAALIADNAADIDLPRDADRLFRLAMLLERHDYKDQALACLERVAEGSPIHVAAELEANRLNYDLGHHESALIRLKALMDSPSATTQVAQLILTQRHLLPQQEAWLRECDQRMPIEVLPDELRHRWYVLRAQLAIARQDWSVASEALASLQGTALESPKLNMALFAMLMHTGQRDQAASMLSRSTSSSDVLAKFVLLGAQTKYEGDGPLLTWLVALAKDDLEDLPDLHTPLAYAPNYYASDLRDDVRDDRAKGEACTDKYQRIGLALLAQHVGMPKLVEEVVMALHEACGESILSLSWLVDAQRHQGKSTRASLAALIERFPNSSRASIELTRRMLAQNDLMAAQTSVDRFLLREPDHPLGLYLQANIHLARGNHDLGLSMLETFGLGAQSEPSTTATFGASRVEQVNTTLEHSLTAAIANDLACILAGADTTRLREAQTLARLAVDLSPQSAAALDTLGWISHLQGDQRNARRHLYRAVTLAPTNQEIHKHLAQFHQSQRRNDWAAYHGEQIHIDPTIMENSKTLFSNRRNSVNVSPSDPNHGGHKVEEAVRVTYVATRP